MEDLGCGDTVVPVTGAREETASVGLRSHCYGTLLLLTGLLGLATLLRDRTRPTRPDE